MVETLFLNRATKKVFTSVPNRLLIRINLFGHPHITLFGHPHITPRMILVAATARRRSAVETFGRT